MLFFLVKDDIGGRVVDSRSPFLVRSRAKTGVNVRGLSVKLLFPQIRLSLTWQAVESCQQLSGYPHALQNRCPRGTGVSFIPLGGQHSCQEN